MSWAERDGTFVKAADLVQELASAPVGPEFALPVAELLWKMSGNDGPINLTALWQEMAKAAVVGYPPRPPGDVRCKPAPFVGNRSTPGVRD